MPFRLAVSFLGGFRTPALSRRTAMVNEGPASENLHRSGPLATRQKWKFPHHRRGRPRTASFSTIGPKSTRSSRRTATHAQASEEGAAQKAWNYELSLGSTWDRTIAGKVTCASPARKRIMKRFKSPRQVQRFLSIHVSGHQSFSFSRGKPRPL
jgi:hypothetical protein